MMNRKEHLEWAQKRALEYAEQDNIRDALGSFMSDMMKHQETANHPGLLLGATLLFTGNLRTKEEVINFINGFN